MIRHVYKPSKRESGKRVFDRLYRGRYRLDGEERIREVPLKTPDKQIAEQRLNKIILDEQREREGLLAPKAERDAAKRRFVDHVEDFIQTRRSVGRDTRYVNQLREKLLRLGRECAWSTAKDVTAQSFEAWRARQSRTSKTLNEYYASISGLMKWLEPRLNSNSLRFVQKVENRGSQKRERRAFTVAELQRLVAVSGARGVVYLTAALTGLRRGELLQLEWRDLHLDAEKPFVNVRASISKNHKQAMLPLHSDLVTALNRLREAGATPTGFVFQGKVPRMRVVQKDLAAAEIPYVDAKGEYADFHSLRKTFGTMLTLAGVPQRVVMELMRHSDMRLTAKTYTDAGMLPTDATVAALPSLSASIPAPQIAPQSLVQTRPALSCAVRETDVPKFAGCRINTGCEGDLTLYVQPWPMPSESGKKSGRQFEPEARPCIDEASAGVTSHIASHKEKTKLEGWEVIEAWHGLPVALRAAILAIVRSHTEATGKRSAQHVPPEPQGLRGGASPSPLPVRGAPFQNGKRREAK